MNTAQILAEATRLGLKFQIRGSDLVVSSAGARPSELLKAIRGSKSEIISALRDQSAELSEVSENCDETVSKSHRIPSQQLPMPCAITVGTANEQHAVVSSVIEQGKPAIRWCLERANEYYLRFPASSFLEQDATAATDLLAWQGGAQGSVLD